MNLPEDRWYTAVEIKPSARAHVHHTTDGNEAIDRTQIGFIFSKEPPKQVHVTGLAVHRVL